MDVPVKPKEVIHGNLRVEHPVGYGAYGQVWKMWHTQLDQPRAVKIIDVANLDEVNLKRVKNECLIGGKLGPDLGVVQVFDAFELGNFLYIVMELMEGGSLDKAIKEEPLSFDVTLDWAIELCAALSAVHDQGIIHRDIKPKNILLTADGRVKLSDFGIAHLPRSEITSYQPGTPGYRAPELETEGVVSPAADVFSLCAVLFELWSGRPYGPYKAQNVEIIRGEFSTCFRDEYPKVIDSTRNKIADLLIQGLDHDPGQRSTLDRLSQSIVEIGQERGLAEPQLERERQLLAMELRPRAKKTIVSRLPQMPVADRSYPPGDTAIIDWLADAFGQWLIDDPDQDIVLWFDPRRDWDGVLELLEEHIDLIQDNGSLLEVRYRLETREPGQQVVVYTPRSEAEADYLMPFTFVAKVFSDSLYQFLIDQGMPLPRYGDARQELENFLPLLVEASRGKGEAFWENISSLEDAEGLLIPNFAERVFQFLAQPKLIWRDFSQSGLLEIFTRMLNRKYGFDVQRESPEQIAQGLFSHWVIVELYIGAGHPGDFPYNARLPHQMNFNECRNDLRTFKHDSRFIDVYLERIRQLEKSQPQLVSWAARYEPLLDSQPLLELARIKWDQAAQKIEKWETRTEVLEGITEIEADIETGLNSYWCRQNILPGWKALYTGAHIINDSRNAIQEASKLSSPGLFPKQYTDTWWQIDTAYRLFQEVLPSIEDLQNFRIWVDHFYDEFLDKVNMRWTKELAKSSSWPPTEGLMSSREGSQNVWKDSERKVVFIIDAFRFELAKDLEEHLQGYKVEFDHWISSVPSVTAIGMASLLPENGVAQVEWDDGWQIAIGPEAQVVSSKAGRIKWLDERQDSLGTVSLAQYLKPNFELDEEINTLVVFSDDLDALGESASDLAITAFADLVEKVARGVQKALTSGFSVVHVLTDHGFVLLGRVQEKGKIEIGSEDALKLAHRYLVGRDLPQVEGLLRFPVFGSNKIAALYPPGLACFKAGGKYNYAHGGISLQEVIVPYVKVREDISYRPTGVEIIVEEKIFSGVFKVSLAPRKVSMFMKEREVKLTVTTEQGEEIFQSSEIVSPNEGITRNIRLEHSHEISIGDSLSISVFDALTGEKLDERSAEVNVDLEL